MNAERTAAGLNPLARASCPNSFALTWARYLAESGAFAHQDLGAVLGGCPGIRAAGENIVRGSVSAEELVRLWMGSPPHRENILAPDYTHTGMGAARGVDGAWTAVQIFIAQ